MIKKKTTALLMLGLVVSMSIAGLAYRPHSAELSNISAAGKNASVVNSKLSASNNKGKGISSLIQYYLSILEEKGYIVIFAPRRQPKFPPQTKSALCDSVTEIPVTECEALEAVYDSTDGANWIDNTNWKVTNTPCSWYGVTCENGHVTELNLYENNLIGTLPSEIGDLSRLTDLYLNDNQLSGNIPSEMGNLSNLVILYLHRNSLNGSIPANLGNLSAIQKLDLSSNSLSGSIPVELGDLFNLEGLFLQENDLTGSIPAELGDLTNVADLNLSYNALTGNIPAELGSMTALINLRLNGNQLTGSIPSELGNPSNLTFVLMDNNELTGNIPASLGNLSLKVLDLGENHLSGTIPAEIWGITSLQLLALDTNQLEGSIPTTVGGLTSLHSLYLQKNKLEGQIPDDLMNVTMLENLNIEYNMLWTNTTQISLNMFIFLRDNLWKVTQTVAPTNVSVAKLNATSVQLSWNRIPYTLGTGYYEVMYSTTSGTYGTFGCQSIDKVDNSCSISGLDSTETYYFAVRTYTENHDDQQNDLLSPFSNEVSIDMSL